MTARSKEIAKTARSRPVVFHSNDTFHPKIRCLAMRDGLIWSVGYGRWPAPRRWEQLVAALQAAQIEMLVDIRHSPCSANLAPEHHYGPRPWHLQAAGGIAAGLAEAGIGYRWLGELGNPQKHDPQMRVLKAHLADPGGDWPIHRGLVVLRRLVGDAAQRCCLLCACADYPACHRRLIVEELCRQLPGYRHAELR